MNTSTLSYDADGNLTFDGSWTYEWDPENRLAAMSMTNLAGIANSNRVRLEFVYDCHSRRISKTVKVWTGSAFSIPVITLFAYDGWNLMTTLGADKNPLTTFLWGQDLSGMRNAAGGVGALLMCSSKTGSGDNCFAAYDGSGNLTALVGGPGSATLGRYEYSPFGELLRATGSAARDNPFRFSTKFTDDETRLVYYGYRYFDPSQGRWIGRDPTSDQMFLNLYAFCNNGSLNAIDRDGRDFSAVGMLCAAGIGGILGGMQNYFLLHGSFLKGFAAGAIGGALSFGLSAELEAAGYSAAWGAALGAGVEQGLKDVFSGQRISGGKIGMAMFFGGALQGILGSAIEEGVGKVLGSKFGQIPGTLSDKLSNVGLDGETIALDTALTVCGNFGMAAAEGTWSLFEEKIPEVGQGLVNPLKKALNNNEDN